MTRLLVALAVMAAFMAMGGLVGLLTAKAPMWVVLPIALAALSITAWCIAGEILGEDGR